MSDSYDFAVRRDDMRETSVLETPGADREIDEGQILLEVDHFSLTANNVTYGAMGEAMNYWDFYPAEDDSLGRIPAWGYADVVVSKAEGIEEGARVFGSLPMSTHAVLEPGRIRGSGFTDITGYRSGLPAVYNEYRLITGEKDDERERLVAIFMPLYGTSWLLADWLNEVDFAGASQLVASSASSKTALGLGHALQVDFDNPIETVGLTSPGNVAFCESLGCYSRVLTYDQLDQIGADTPCAYVDFAGNGGLRLQIHTRFTALRYSCSIGGTHVTQLAGAKDLPGPRATLFFAPAQIKKRTTEWGGAELGKRLVMAWRAFASRVHQPAAPWMTVEHHRGPSAVQDAYNQVLAGRGDPRLGHMLSML